MNLNHYLSQPIYGLDAAILSPLWGMLSSILLLIGVWRVGSLILSLLRQPLGGIWSVLSYHAGLVGLAALSCIVFPMALLGIFNRTTAAALASFLVVLGSFGVLTALQSARSWVGDWEYSGVPTTISRVCIGMLGGYLLLALAPVTDADSLDYHVGVALKILNGGSLPADPEWFHSRLAGAGETLIALGLAIGAEQFGALLQWMGLASIVTMVLTVRSASSGKSQGVTVDHRGWLLLLLLSTPVFVAWVASPKPMLLPGGMTTLALYISHYMFTTQVEQSVRMAAVSCALIFSLLLVAVCMKFSFILSAGLITGLTLLYQSRKNRLPLALLVLAVTTSAVYLPFLIWKWVSFGGTPLELLVKPLPGGWPGTSEFMSYLRSYRDSTLPFPLSLVAPTDLGNLTTVLGLGLPLIIIVIFNKRVLKNHLILLAGLMTVLGVILGQLTSRFFLEPYYWCILGILMSGSLAHLQISALTVSKILATLQGTSVAVMILFGITTISFGSFSPELRTQVMRLAANDYRAMRWVDEVLPSNAVVLSELRSMALIPRQSYSTDFKNFTSANSSDRNIYLSKIDWTDAPFYLLTSQVTPDSIPPECLGEMFAGPLSTETATRNPWNRGTSYQVWLYEVKTDCIVEGSSV